MSTSNPTTMTTADGTVLYECGDDFVTKEEYDEYCAAESEAVESLG